MNTCRGLNLAVGAATRTAEREPLFGDKLDSWTFMSGSTAMNDAASSYGAGTVCLTVVMFDGWTRTRSWLV